MQILEIEREPVALARLLTSSGDFLELLVHIIELIVGDDSATKTSYEADGEGLLLSIIECGANLGEEDAGSTGDTKSNTAVDNADSLEAAEGSSDLLGRERTESAETYDASLDTLVAEDVSNSLGGLGVGTLLEDYVICIVAEVLFQPRIIVAAHDLVVLGNSLLDDGTSILDGPVALVLHEGAFLGLSLGTDDLGLVYEQAMARLERRQELVNSSLIRLVNGLDDVRYEVTILAGILRKHYVVILTDAIVHEGDVESLFSGGSPALDPALVTAAHCVGVLFTKVSRRVESTVGDSHLRREALTSHRRIELECVDNAYTRGTSECTSTSGGSTVGDGQLTVLTLAKYELSVKLAISNHASKLGHDTGVRTDRIRADYINISKLASGSSCDATCHLLVCHCITSLLP